MASLPHKSPSIRQGQLVLAATRSPNSLQNLVETIVRPTNVKSSVSRGRRAGGLLGVVGGLLSLAAALAGQYTGATLWCGAAFACLCSIFSVLTLRTHKPFAPVALVLSAAFGMVFSALGVSVILLVPLAGGALALFACLSQQEANQDDNN
jgi:hypothetical protein